MGKLRQTWLLGVASFAWTGTALAQNAVSEPAATGEAGVTLADIVVTAQKRASNVQNTPIAIRAFEGETVQKQGVTDIVSLARIAPDLGVTSDTTYTKIAIRGVSSIAVDESADPALTIAIDGEYINRPSSLNASFFDLERIEVLRGPQGTLYGRNSTAGAINIVAAKPELQDFGGFVTASYGNYDAKTVQGALNVPLGSIAAVRIAGLHTQHDGYTDNRGTFAGQPVGGRGDDANVDAIRVGVRIAPTDRLSVYIAGEYIDVDQKAPSQFGSPVSATDAGVVQLPAQPGLTNPLSYTIPSGYDLPAGADRSAYPLQDLGYLRSKQYAVRGSLEYDFGPATLIYVGGYRKIDDSNRQPLNGYIPSLFTFNNNKRNSETQSHELRLSGGQEGQFIWQLGGFYFRESQDVSRGLFLPLALGGSYVSYFYRPDFVSQSKAVFAQGTYWIVPDKLGVTGGVRYTKDKKTSTFVNFGGQFGFGPNPPSIDDSTRPGYSSVFHRSTSSKITWTAGVDYKVGSRNLLYAKVNTGYKAGGFDNASTYDPEKITAYEFGSKNEFADRTIQFNVAAFYYEYTNQQVAVFRDLSVGNVTLNVGKSRVYGLETDTTIVLSPDDRFQATINYLDAKLTRFNGVPALTFANAPAGVAPALLDLAGNRPPQAPKWVIGLSYDHTFHLGDGTLVASANTRFKSEYYITALNWRGDRENNYTQTDLNLTYKAPSDRFNIQLYVRNLENYRPKVYSAFTGGGINNYNWIFGQPRTYGIQGTFNF